MSEEWKAKTYDIVAFKVPDHHSLGYWSWVAAKSVPDIVLEAIKREANVISIRLVESGNR